MDKSLHSRGALRAAAERYRGKEADNPASTLPEQDLELLKDIVRFNMGKLDQDVATGKLEHPGWAERRKRELAAIVARFQREACQ